MMYHTSISYRLKFRVVLATLCLWPIAPPALARDDCDVPVERWQSRDAVRQHAALQGWQLRQLKIDDGCYEIRGRDAQGHVFKAKLDPETLRVVKIKRDNDRGRKNSRDANRQAEAKR
jgi:hypothetical protein